MLSSPSSSTATDIVLVCHLRQPSSAVLKRKWTENSRYSIRRTKSRSSLSNTNLGKTSTSRARPSRLCIFTSVAQTNKRMRFIFTRLTEVTFGDVVLRLCARNRNGWLLFMLSLGEQKLTEDEQAILHVAQRLFYFRLLHS